MALSPKQHKVIAWIAERDNLRPQLSAYPIIRFLDADGNEVKHNIADLVLWYDGRKAAEAREERRQKSKN